MRTIKLTHRQIELIVKALGIAEQKYSAIYKKINADTINVRRSVKDEDEKQAAMKFFTMACELADLNIDIDTGKLDV